MNLLVCSNEPIKSLMIQIMILIRNYLNIILGFLQLVFQLKEIPKALVPHMLQTSVMWVYLMLYLQMNVSGPSDTMSLKGF